MKGKLIVIEGIDSSGKTTQLTLLKDFLKSQNKSFQTIHFPQYNESFYGKMLASFLRGELGQLEQVNPYIISVIYALDRAEAKEKIERWLQDGEIIIASRYATSNMAHQAGRLSKNEREKFIDWDTELEYTINKIPREDLVILLDMPHKLALALMENDDRTKSLYKKGEKKDMVEKSEAYSKSSEEVYKWLAGKFPHWKRVAAVDKQGKLRTRLAIHEEIKRVLEEKDII